MREKEGVSMRESKWVGWYASKRRPFAGNYNITIRRYIFIPFSRKASRRALYPGLNIDESREEHPSWNRNLKVCRGWRWISSRAVPRRMGTCIYSSDIKSTGNGKGVFDDWAANCFSPPRSLGPFLCFSSLFITIEHDFEESNHGFKFRLYKSVLHPNISREALSWQHGLTLFFFPIRVRFDQRLWWWGEAPFWSRDWNWTWRNGGFVLRRLLKIQSWLWFSYKNGWRDLFLALSHKPRKRSRSEIWWEC